MHALHINVGLKLSKIFSLLTASRVPNRRRFFFGSALSSLFNLVFKALMHGFLVLTYLPHVSQF